MRNHFPELLKSLQGQVIAHRGAPKFTPENTRASFKKAADLGAKWVEFDTQLCGSGDWVVIHDDTLERTTDGKGLVAELPYESLMLLDAGSWFDPTFKGERILLLSEVLNLLPKLGLKPNIEIKCSSTPSHQQLLGFLDILNESSVTKFPFLLSSFDFEVLNILKLQNNKLPLGYIVENIDVDTVKKVQDMELFSLHCDYENLHNEQLKAIINEQINLFLYTVNDPNQARKFFENGVLAIFSDFPNLLDPNFYSSYCEH